MPLRFATWNVNRRRLKPSHLKFLARISPEVLALQEASPAFINALRSAGMFASVVSASQFASDLPPQRANLSCALAVKESITVGEPATLPVPLPERSIAVSVTKPGCAPVTVCSIHIPCGVSWKQIKGDTFTSIVSWLENAREHIIIGIDANSPKVDHPVHDENEWWNPEEALLLGARVSHSLTDAYRAYLDRHPSQLEAVAQQSPAGPLAVTHKTGMTRRIYPRRYDFILVPRAVEVLNIDHHYEGAIEAGSDHGLVVADLRTP